MADLDAEQIIELIDNQCDEFERLASTGPAPDIADFLSNVSEPLKPQLFAELLAVELELTARRGLWPNINNYQETFPEYAESIERAFEALKEWAQSTDVFDVTTIQDTAARDQDTVVVTGKVDSVTTQTENPEKPASEACEDLPVEFGRYRLLQLLGRGGMGAVYLAHDTQLDRNVALKVPDFERVANDVPAAIERFYREARSMATVSHPNLCPVYDVGEHNGCHFLTMKYITGEPLSEQLKDGQPLDVQEAVRITGTLAISVQAAHDAGIVHRDLKPSNVMINDRDQPIIMDFGLAHRDHDNEVNLTDSHTVIGSPAYMAPEQVRGDREQIGPATDVYALGVILYQLLSGHRPYAGSKLAVLGEIVSGVQPKSLSHLPHVSRRLNAVCFKAMSGDIAGRYSSALEFAEALNACAPGDSAASLKTPAWTAARLGAITLLAVMACFAAFPVVNNDAENLPTNTEVLNTGASTDRPAATASEQTHRETPVRVAAPPVRLVDSGQRLGDSVAIAVAVGDLDNDGDIDAYVANGAAAPDQIWWNDGFGRFQPGPLGRSERTSDVQMGDLDNDGDLDAVIVSTTSHSLQILENDGNGNFQQIASPPFEGKSRGLALGDLDSDGDLDLAIGVEEGPSLIWTNNGEGVFTDSEQRLGTANTMRARLADLDGDSDLDLVAVNWQAHNRIWLNDGNGSFNVTDQKLGSTKSMTLDAALADVDQDGDIDLCIGNEEPSILWLNNGRAEFEPAPIVETMESQAVVVADFNADDCPEIIMGHGVARENPLQILSRNTVDEPWRLNIVGAAATTDIALADFDNDGDLDAFIVTNGNLPCQVWLNESLSDLTPHTAIPASKSTRQFVDSGQLLGNGESRAVRLADFDRDGDLDAFVINRYEEPNRIWLNDGTGTFHDSEQQLGSSYSRELAIGDIDGDSDPDAVVVNAKGQDTVIWLNDGTGRFKAGEQTIASTDGHAIVMADFDGDDDLDLMIGDTGANRVWLNDGSGRFTDSGQLLGDAITRGLAAGDVNNDGFADVFAANGGGLAAQSDRVWLNDGKGNFSDNGQVLDARKSMSVSLSDLNGDGSLDAYTVADNTQPGTLWINSGDGQFRKTELPHLLHGVSVSLGDLDGDGDTDSFVANSSNQPNYVLLNDGHGGFAPTTTQWIGAASSSGSALGDLDGDGDPDAFVTNFRSQPNRVWLNVRREQRPPEIRDSGQQLEPSSATHVELADLDGDSDLDALIATSHSEPNSIWWNDGLGRFTMDTQPLGTSSLRGLAVGDLDSDGDMDVLLACEDGPNTVWLNDGDGRFTATDQQIGNSNTAKIALADFDSDGDLDAWAGNLDPHHDRVWLNDGTGSFRDSGQLLGVERNWAVNTADVDGDGDVDVLVGTIGGRRNSLWLNDGRAVFTRSDEVLSNRASSNGFVAGDLNGDGAVDLYETDYYDASDRVWINDGAGHFNVTGQVIPGLKSKHATLSDLDQDGHLDVIVPRQGNERNYVMFNNGSGYFGDRINFGNGRSASLAVGDLDGDGDFDIFVAHHRGMPHRVWLNR